MKRFSLSLILLLILSQNLFAEDLEKYNGMVIKDIVLKGLINTDKDIVIAGLNFKRGDLFDYKILTGDFKSLEGTGFFEKIKVNIKESGDGIIVEFLFEERPKVGAIVIEGEDELDEDDIIAAMILKPGNIYKDADLIIDEEKISLLYKRKGIEGSTVSVRARKGENNKLVNIIVEINEGNEVYIESIRVIGTKQLDPDDLYDQMVSKEGNILSSDETYDPRKVAYDKKKIEEYMKNNGFFLGRVKSVKVKKDYIDLDSPDEKEKGFYMIVEVEEGNQYTMGDITFSGYTVFKEKEIVEKITMKKGEIYNDSKLKDNLNKIQEMYFNRGYIQLQLVSTPRIDEKNRIIHWDIEFIEGEKVHIERIRITGHEKTKIWVIDREIRIFEGETFNMNKVKKSANKIQNTQYFKVVNPKPVPKDEDGLTDLHFKVTEQRTGLITMGAGFGTLSGFSVFEEVQEKNFFGYGWALKERVEVGERRLSAEVGTSTNWLLAYTPVTFNLTFRYLRDIIDASYSLFNSSVSSDTEYSYKYEAVEIDFNFGHFLNDDWLIYTGYLISFSKSHDPKNFNLSDIDSSTTRGQYLYDDLVEGAKGGFLSKISQRLGLVYDTRDLTLNTTSGWRIRWLFTYTGGVYGGDSQWLKFENNYSYYINPIWKIVFAFYVGYEIFFEQFDGNYEIRDVDRLRFDGLNQLRGWRTRYTDEIVGRGGKIALINEMRFPIFEELLWGVLFLDGGDVTDNLGTIPGHINYWSFGFGFRIQIPLIPIRFYFAKKMDYNVTNANDLYLYPGLEIVFSVGGYF